MDIKIYKKAYIYKLVGVNDSNNELFYIGSTVNKLSNRKAIHKYHYKIKKENKDVKGVGKCSSYKIFDTCGENIRIEIMEELNDITKEIIREKENHYILLNKDNINCVNINRSYNGIEYKKEILKLNSKKYYHNNLQKCQEQKRDYYNRNKETILNKAKDNYKNNKNNIKEYMKNYREEYFKRPEVIERLRLLKEQRERENNE